MNKLSILLYPFDKGFFGKTLMECPKNNIKISQSSKFEHDSIDDLNRHFAMQLFNRSLEKTPVVDTFNKDIEKELSSSVFGLNKHFNIF
ncbi:hypothetical protein HDR58_11235 [bacterium]|nr:hypothetical protein [bacterium]